MSHSTIYSGYTEHRGGISVQADGGENRINSEQRDLILPTGNRPLRFPLNHQVPMQVHFPIPGPGSHRNGCVPSKLGPVDIPDTFTYSTAFTYTQENSRRSCNDTVDCTELEMFFMLLSLGLPAAMRVFPLGTIQAVYIPLRCQP